MKVFGKWLVMVTDGNGKSWIGGSFTTKREAIDSLNSTFTALYDGTWESEQGYTYRIEKNTKEYK